jgi:acetyl-CoA C-acetyltransferase
MMENVFIVSAKRTATGSFMGSLSHLSAITLGSMVIRESYQAAGLPPHTIESVYMGNVLSANLGQSPARQASLGAGIPVEADCTTINKVCASGLKAVMIGAQQIQLGEENLVVAGGMESMSNAPHYSYQRKGTKLGTTSLVDGLLIDGLTDPYHQIHMGNVAEICARSFSISREEQDDYALLSYEKATQATRKGKFKNEIVPVTITTKGEAFQYGEDEDIYKVKPEKMGKLPPVFEEGGTITAANASNLSDGAAALVLASGKAVQSNELKPVARILSYADAAQAPEWFTTAPAVAIQKALLKASLALKDIDFWEINEAYAAVMIANQKLLDVDPEKVNVYGGAIAIGHPLGASGARILCTLLSVLVQEGGRYGVAAICNGGGGASAMVIENLHHGK